MHQYKPKQDQIRSALASFQQRLVSCAMINAQQTLNAVTEKCVARQQAVGMSAEDHNPAMHQ